MAATASATKNLAAHTHAATGDLPVMEVPCCPQLVEHQACDVLDFHYRLVHPTTVLANDRPVQVEVLIHARFERCPGPMTLGDLAYSTTLLPGEKVKLFTSDRRTRFSFDSESKLSYRQEQTSEERFFLSSLHDFMSDVSVRDSSSASASSKGSTKGHAGASSALGTLFNGPSVDVSGSYDASSTSSFLRELSQHASSSDRRSESGTRAASSVSVGEVASRTHTEGESSDHFEAATREITNPNRCHAVTYYFYQINKTQTVRFSIVAIQRRVIDPAANTRLTNNPFVGDGDVSTIPTALLATDAKRLQVEAVGRAADQARSSGAGSAAANAGAVGSIGLLAADAATLTRLSINQAVALKPIPEAQRSKALAQVDASLLKQGLITRDGKVSPTLVAELSYERTSSLPTPGLLVKGCLDSCETCEPELEEAIQLELEHKRLQNKLLEKQIELLEKSREYRCCGDDEDCTKPVPADAGAM